MDGDTRGLGSRETGEPRRPSRRLLVLGASGAAAAGLAVLVDRGLRLDLPPPPAPVPTRRPAPDEALLVAAVADLERIAEAETSVLSSDEGSALVRRLRTLTREQLRVLRGRLTNAGVPTSAIAAGIGAGTSGPDEPVRTRKALAALLDSVGPDDWAGLAAATDGTRTLLGAAYAQRLAAAALLGRDVGLPSSSPARPGILERTQPLVYAFGVVAAQSTDAQRRSAQRTLDALVRLRSAVSGAGSTTPAGWALPFPVTTPAAAARLATRTLASAVDAGTELAGRDRSAASLEDVARWSATISALAVDWDVPLTAFPGATS